MKKQDSPTSARLYDILVEQRFFIRSLTLIAIIILLFSSRILFLGFSPGLVRFVYVVSQVTFIIWTLLVLYSLLNAWEKFFKLHPKTQQKSLKGYIQLLKIILGIVGVIFVIATVVDEDPATLFLGFGATAAFITLIFKGTILGFVASIQLSFQDMIRPGDWIEVPSKNANGLIVDINLNSVKVQNWDNSVTMVPIDSLISDSFTNWRRMEQGPGRLFERTFHVNVKSVSFVTDELLTFLSNNRITSTHYDEVLALAQKSSPGAILTNLALFRAHIELFLHKHPHVNETLWLFVRYAAEISDSGIGVEIYAFSRQKSIKDYDLVHRSVMEYVISTASLYNIVLYQAPSGDDIRKLRDVLR